MSASSGGDSQGGLMAGLRAGLRAGSGLVVDAQVIRHSASSAGLSTTQMLAGIGSRYHFVDAEFSPFVSGHINHHFEAELAGGGESIAIEDSSGLGLDVGGGVQFDLNGTMYAEASAHYAVQFMGDPSFDSFGVGIGAGIWF